MSSIFSILLYEYPWCENILIEVEPPLNVNNPPTSDKDNTDISDVFATCLRGFRLSWLSWF